MTVEDAGPWESVKTASRVGIWPSHTDDPRKRFTGREAMTPPPSPAGTRTGGRTVSSGSRRARLPGNPTNPGSPP